MGEVIALGIILTLFGVFAASFIAFDVDVEKIINKLN